ncbi:MAG TPA: histidinol-phosphate transaminase, partial [Candidatus Lokiarchaeia archaeon]|nr:histidinol-phosphate transaminase [Candidatus Lokiarchaeia archaeon]
LKRKGFDDMVAYVPGWQPPDREGWVKLNTNESPYAPPEEVLEEIRANVDATLRLYPDPAARELRELVVSVLLSGIDPSLGIENVMWGLGSDEILDLLLRTFVDPGDHIVYFNPSYGMYDVLARVYLAERTVLDLDDDFDIPPDLDLPEGKLLIICSPNNPNGRSFSNETIERLCSAFSGIVLVDEAYADFASTTALSILSANPKLVVARTFSKSASLAGERIGILVGAREIIDAISVVKLPFNMTRLNQVAACASLRHYDKIQENLAKIIEQRERLAREIPNVDPNLTPLPSDANFLLVQCPSAEYARGLMEGLKERKVLIRYFEKPRLSSYVRISVGSPEENDILLETLAEVLKTL